MDHLRGNIKTLYFKYLSAAFGSALISSIYGIVDMAMVGQYRAPTARRRWPCGRAGVERHLQPGPSHGHRRQRDLQHEARQRHERRRRGRAVFYRGGHRLGHSGGAHVDRADPLRASASDVFGTDETLLALAQRYMIPVKVVFPLFLFNQMLAAFLRNDGAPALAMLGVLSGGIFNVFGDWFFVFPCDMGVYGAGLATALGSAVSFLVMLTHFASRKNTLRLVKPKRLDAKAT